MSGGSPLGRWRVFVIVPIALACLAFPFVLLALQEDQGLIDDTRAWLGSGTAEGVPAVSRVSCFRRSYGSSSSRGLGSSDWSCTLYLEPRPQPGERDPRPRMTYEEAIRENERQIAALGDLLRPGATIPGKLERVLASDRTGDLPVLRRLSAEGEPPRFGIVWSGWELAGRWLYRLLLSALFIAIGLFSLHSARGIWRRSRR